MATILSPSDEAQLGQTIEMFEVITQSQPHDYQSLEILKEAYSKLSREADVISTSKRIAQAYVQMGQLSSAILEYETILQRFPDDPDVQAALQQIESKANNFPVEPATDPAVPKALKILCDKSRFAFLPIASYDIDMDLARSFPGDTCQRWCVLPFDRMSKSILVATANPFNQQAVKELSQATPNRLLWYLVPP